MARSAEEELGHDVFYLLPQFNTDSPNLQVLSDFSSPFATQKYFTTHMLSVAYKNIKKSGNEWEKNKLKAEKESKSG
jgi:hypothetical protein